MPIELFDQTMIRFATRNRYDGFTSSWSCHTASLPPASRQPMVCTNRHVPWNPRVEHFIPKMPGVRVRARACATAFCDRYADISHVQCTRVVRRVQGELMFHSLLFVLTSLDTSGRSRGVYAVRPARPMDTRRGTWMRTP
jgi:hypothetical protein